MRTFLIIVLFGITLSAGSASLFCRQSGRPRPACDWSVICPGETLTYEVSWLSIKLGQVRLVTSSSTIDSGRLFHHAAAFIDSYSGLPFVDVHAIDHSDFDSSFHSRGFRSSDKKDDYWKTEHSFYDFPRHLVFIENITQRTRKSPPDGPPVIDTITVNDTLMEDGLSVLYFTRAYVHTKKSTSMPTLVYRKLGTTHFTFPDEISAVEVEAFPGKKLRALRCDGKAEFEGLFGLTGDFTGWFSDDNPAVPLRAEMKVLVGSVKLELIQYSRAGWHPPEFFP